MYLTLALVVLIGAIVVLFSKEFIQFIKKILAIKGALLILPIALASWLVYTFEPLCLWGAYYYREILVDVISVLSALIPYPSIAAPVVTILLLTLLSVGPVFLMDWIMWRRSYQRYPYPYLTSSLIWIVSSMILVPVL